MLLEIEEISSFIKRYQDFTSGLIDDEKEAISSFIKRYQDFTSGLIDDRASSFVECFKNLSRGLEPLKKERQKDQIENAPDFNIFKILDVADDENKHSDFLAGLLTTKGSHGQKKIFLNEFINLLKKKGANIPEGELCAIVKREKWTETEPGRIDINIEFGGKTRFAIIIENKINSPDQEKQLERYYEDAKIRYDDFLLVYLTPYGEDPSEISINQELREELKKRNELILLSYKYDIAKWLETAKEEVKPPHLRQTLQMYIDTIREL